jgi:TolB-like protein
MWNRSISQTELPTTSSLNWRRRRLLLVIARKSSFTYKGRAVDVKQVAREQGAGQVLEGSVRRGGDRIRVVAQLIDAKTGIVCWALCWFTVASLLEDVTNC